MGQYHIVVNFTKKEYIRPSNLDDGAKLMEQMNSLAGTASALIALLAASNGRGGGDIEYQNPVGERVVGRWAGDKIGIVGDYYEKGDFSKKTYSGEENLYSHVKENFTEISHLLRPMLENACNVTFTNDNGRFRVNSK